MSYKLEVISSSEFVSIHESQLIYIYILDLCCCGGSSWWGGAEQGLIEQKLGVFIARANSIKP